MTRAESEALSQTEWERVLPAWKSKKKSRGLKAWKSKSARGGWSITGVCAKVINKSVSIYMEIFGLPPVVEGERGSGSLLSVKSGGLDLYTPFLLTVHRAYCQNLNPEVENGMVAYDKVIVVYYVLDISFDVFVHILCSCMQVLQYMHTRPVRLKLLRAVHIWVESVLIYRLDRVEGVLVYRLDRVSWYAVLTGCLGIPS